MSLQNKIRNVTGSYAAFLFNVSFLSVTFKTGTLQGSTIFDTVQLSFCKLLWLLAEPQLLILLKFLELASSLQSHTSCYLTFKSKCLIVILKYVQAWASYLPFLVNQRLDFCILSLLYSLYSVCCQVTLFLLLQYSIIQSFLSVSSTKSLAHILIVTLRYCYCLFFYSSVCSPWCPNSLSAPRPDMNCYFQSPHGFSLLPAIIS